MHHAEALDSLNLEDWGRGGVQGRSFDKAQELRKQEHEDLRNIRHSVNIVYLYNTLGLNLNQFCCMNFNRSCLIPKERSFLISSRDHSLAETQVGNELLGVVDEFFSWASSCEVFVRERHIYALEVPTLIKSMCLMISNFLGR